MKVYVCKALPTTDEKVPDGTIHITQEIPRAIRADENIDLGDLNVFYEHQAKMIVDVLTKTLPQGTKHKLLGLMLREWQNLYMGV